VIQKIAYIVSDKELSNHKKLDWINYVILNGEPFHSFTTTQDGKVQFDAPRYNSYYPTLIIGWELFNTTHKEFNPDILEKTKSRPYNVEWEFSVDERIVDHFEGVANFIKTAPRKYVEQFRYKNIDPIIDKIEKEEDVLELVKKYQYLDHIRTYQYKDEVIYLFDRGSSTPMLGIYLTAFKYFKYDVEKIKSLIYSAIKPEHIFLDPDGQNYGTYYKQFPDFDQLKRSMVLFLA